MSIVETLTNENNVTRHFKEISFREQMRYLSAVVADSRREYGVCPFVSGAIPICFFTNLGNLKQVKFPKSPCITMGFCMLRGNIFAVQVLAPLGGDGA